MSTDQQQDRGTSPSSRARVRKDTRAHYVRETVNAILDEAPVAHVGIVVDGAPVVIPMLHVRDGDRLLLHGSGTGRLIRAAAGAEICVTVTLVDAWVLARSAFHHSANYRSVVVHGVAEIVDGFDERRGALDAFTDKIVPGRREHLREMTDREVTSTGVLALSLDESAAKIRSGGPIDEPADLDLPIWAGVLPLRTVADAPIPSPDLPDGLAVPEHVHDLAEQISATTTQGAA